MENQVSMFIHQEDRMAMENLKCIPLLAGVTKAFLKVWSEQQVHGLNMARKIRLSPDQLPGIYNHLPPLCAKLGIVEPEFYLEMNPMPNAYTMGDTRIFITVTSGLIEHMDEGELKAVLAHECGHIACRHTLYHTMARYLAEYGLKILGPLGVPAKPVVWALFYWSRRSEYSADRAAAYALGGEEEVVETIIRLAGGPKHITESVNLDAYMEQSRAYDRLFDSNWDRLLQTLVVAEATHPFNSVRVRELRSWCSEPGFQKMIKSVMAGNGAVCPNCGRTILAGWKFCQGCGAKLRTNE